MISRPFNWLNTAVPFMAGFLIAGGGINIKLIVGVMYFSFFYNVLMYGINDIFDYESDRKNPRKGSIEGAVVAKQKHRWLTYIILGVNLPVLIFLLVSGTVASNLVLILIIFLAFSYSAKPFRFKEVPILDSINSSLHFVLPVVFGFVYAESVSLPWPAIIALFFWGAASHALGAIQDIKPDRAAKIHSIATKFGARTTNTFSLVLYLLSCIIVALAYFPWGLAAATILLVYPLNVIFFRKFRSDAKSHEYNRAWKNFIWLNLLCGFWLTQLLLFVFDPFSLGIQRITWFAVFLLGFGMVQLIMIIYNYRQFLRPKTKRVGDLPHIDIIMHSYGDKDNIASTLLALIGQNYPHFDIYYANIDHNQQAQRIAESYQDSKLHIINVEPPPAGWSAQAWASHCLLRKTRSELVVLVGADTLLLPNTLSVIASQFENTDNELISLLPADQNKSFWQQLIMSQEQYMLLGLYPSARITNTHPELATAYSTLLAFRRQQVNKAGGFELVRKSPLEDLDIANKAKQAGLKTAFYTASDLAVNQNRSGFRELRQYNEQRLYPSLHFNMPFSLAIISGGMTVLTVPILLLSWLLFIGQYEGTIVLALACLILLTNRLIIMIRSKQSVIGGLLYPFGSFILLSEVFFSMLRYELHKPRWQSRHEL